MGAPKQKWTSEEEDALRAGVDKHGAGKWRTIQKDPEFCHCLATRSNIDLKDKWRNMIVSATGQGIREKSRTPKSKDQSTTQSSSQSPRVQAPANVEKQPTVESTKAPHDAKIPSRYNAIIMEALTVLHEPNGSEIGAICKYIEQRMEIPSGFRRLLGSKLRRLVAQNKIVKGPKGYQLKEPSFATKTPTQKQKEPANRSKPPQASGFTKPLDPVEEAAITAAYKIADAEAKAFLASEAVKEAEKISKMAEETDSLLMLAKEIFERCVRGEIVTMA
ncbi:single myb histone 4 [Dendrobium catenatum]|uniref:Telomere repeat-binding factor 5 n=1 Tax=Dendrobium catenatum TaxID=906689 RepID=A0A2I0X3P8_9ASPA|nr:single myb histone 4 [Dendrobium catenatum]PKU82533.1 Telomere repeat-binding factor 5 [Dendrobium catenatum]